MDDTGFSLERYPLFKFQLALSKLGPKLIAKSGSSWATVKRPIVLLLSQATNGLSRDWARKLREAHSASAGGLAEELDKPLI